MGLEHLNSAAGERFIAACSRLTAFLGGDRPLVADEFSRLPAPDQERVLAMVEATALCAEEMQAQGQSPMDAGALSWRVLSHMGLRPDSSSYTLFRSGDMIDIYNSDHKLIFASLNFLKVSAYPLDTLYSRPWMELWDRSSAHLETIFAAMSSLLDLSVPGTAALALEPDTITEKCSGRQAVVRNRGFSRVSGDHGSLAIMCVNELCAVLPTA